MWATARSLRSRSARHFSRGNVPVLVSTSRSSNASSPYATGGSGDQDTARAKKLKLERHHVPWLRSLDRLHRDRAIECDKSPSVPNRKSKQVEIRQLARSVNARGIDPFLVN
jgi:hypothetical protein